MELKLTKSMTCRVAARGRWGNLAAAWMGLSFFLRMVYYFGLRNMNDIPGIEIAFSVVLPIAVSVAFILLLKIQKLNLPIAYGAIAAVFAVNYLLCETMSFGGVVSGALVLGVSGLILAAVLGFIPERKWLLWAGMAAVLVRVVFVDVFGYILPLGEWDIIGYIPRASNLCGVIAVSLLGAAMRLRKAE